MLRGDVCSCGMRPPTWATRTLRAVLQRKISSRAPEGNARHKMDQGCFECGIEYLHGTIVPMRFKNMGCQALSRGRVAVQQNVYSVHCQSYLEQHLLYNAFTKVATRRVGLHI